jgi:hypothetical protein
MSSGEVLFDLSVPLKSIDAAHLFVQIASLILEQNLMHRQYIEAFTCDIAK